MEPKIKSTIMVKRFTEKLYDLLECPPPDGDYSVGFNYIDIHYADVINHKPSFATAGISDNHRKDDGGFDINLGVLTAYEKFVRKELMCETGISRITYRPDEKELRLDFCIL